MLLHYPGSKFRASRDILSLAGDYSEWRDCFAGGASILWRVPRDKRRWINDLDSDVVRFHKSMRDDPEFIEKLDTLCEWARSASEAAIRREWERRKWIWRDTGCPVCMAFCRMFVVGGILLRQRANIASFNASFNNLKSKTRARMDQAREVMQGVQISEGQYYDLLDAPGDGVCCFLDPGYFFEDHYSPYYSIRFGKSHFEELADRLYSCSHHFVMTVNICGLTMRLFERSNRFKVYRRRYYYTLFKSRRRHAWEYIILPN